MKRLIAVGGDARYTCLAEGARALGVDARHMDAERAPDAVARADCLVMPNPYGEKGGPTDLPKQLGRGSLLALFGPGKAPPLVAGRLRVCYLSADEVLLRDLARQTAEGAIHICQQKLRRELWRCAVAVVGYGRIARELVRMLTGMGAAVTVAARKEAAREAAGRLGARAVDLRALPSVLSEQRVIFSTPPARVLGMEELRAVDRNALLMDLSSPPYGVDLEAAAALGLNAWREPALPGRYCPESAGEALLHSILRFEKGLDKGKEASGHA